MDLFKHFPRIVAPQGEQDLIPPEERQKYSAFGAEFAILERELMPSFRALNNQALRRQNAYRSMYVVLILGGSLATILGIVQLAVNNEWVGITGAVVAALLGIATLVSRSFHHQERYLDARLAAEFLRAEYFFFLGHLAPYDDELEQHRVATLIQRVTDIKIEGESYATA